MHPSSDWQRYVEESWGCLERWDVPAARDAAQKARSIAAAWAQLTGNALSDVLTARAQLLVSPDPAGPNLVLDMSEDGPWRERLHAAVTRFEVERATARGTAVDMPAFQLDLHSPVDLMAAATMACTQRLEDASRPPPRIIGGAGFVQQSEARSGWAGLVEALELEASGKSGMAAIDGVLRAAERDSMRELLWSALRLRVALCVRRGAHGEAREGRERMRRLVESWALTLPAADAAAALLRADRAAIGSIDVAAGLSSPRASRLIEVALALGQERDQKNLIDIALDAAIAVSGAERGVLLLLDSDQGYRVASTRLVGAEIEAQALLGLSSTVARRALAGGKPVVSSDVRADPRFAECASVSASVTSILCVPIHARAELEGAIYLDRTRAGHAFSPEAVSAASAIGGMLAAALLNGRVIGDLQERTRELEVAREELAVALATRTVERDDVTRRLADVEGVAPGGASGMIGNGRAMTRLLATLKRVAASDVPVLVTGETGSGKELAARAIHAASPRRDKPFVAVNCGALSESLLEAELFGVERGAYTGALTSRPGLFVAADGGTLFLDEVGDMPPAMQKALLRVLETSEIRAVGATQIRKVNVRVVSASHRDLLALVRANAFRDDLRYRLEVVRLEMPALREHLEDMPQLCQYLLDDIQRRYTLPRRRLSPEALNQLCQRRWPGNVRELRHVLASAALASNAEAILPSELPDERAAQESFEPSPSAAPPGPDGHAVRVESIRRALRATAGHRGQAAEMLGISRSTFYRYIELYSLDMEEFDPAEASRKP